MRPFDAQRGRDYALLLAYHRSLQGSEPNFENLVVMQNVMDENALTPRLIALTANELTPALTTIRASRYNLGPVALRSIAARIDTAIKLIEEGEQ